MLKGLVAYDIVGKMFQRLLDSGWIIDKDTGKMKAITGMKSSTNWIWVNPDAKHKCNVYMEIFNSFNFVPTPCMGCWKVVVKPRTLLELMKVYAFQKKFTADCMGKDRFCKCGVETRPWTHYNYGAYFYTDSKKQGLYRYKQVRTAVDKIDPEIPVILKRYCTEFELGTGPTDKYVRPDNADVLEKLVMDNIDFDYLGDSVRQPDYLVQHCIRDWIEFAWDRADPTAKMFNDDEPLYPDCVTYHDKYAGVEDKLKEKYGGKNE